MAKPRKLNERNVDHLEALAECLEKLEPTADPQQPDRRLNEPGFVNRWSGKDTHGPDRVVATGTGEAAEPQRLNLEIGITAEGQVGGISAFAVSLAAKDPTWEPLGVSEPASLDKEAAQDLGIDEDTARALFDGPNDISGARRWIEPADAAKACRLIAAGEPPQNLWPEVDTRKLVELARNELQNGPQKLSGGCLISPDAEIDPTAIIERKAEIGPGARIGANARLETGATVAAGVTVEHDAVMKRYSLAGFGSHIGAGATVHAAMGENVHVGAGATIEPEADSETLPWVGAGSWVGDGATVTGRTNDALPPGSQVAAATEVKLSELPLDETFEPGDRRPEDQRTGDVAAGASVDETARVARGAVVGPGCTLGPWTVVEAGAHLERDVALHAGAKVEAGAKLGTGCYLKSGASVGAGATLGRVVVVGTNARVAPKSEIIDEPEDGAGRRRKDIQVLPSGCQISGRTYMPVQQDAYQTDFIGKERRAAADERSAIEMARGGPESNREVPGRVHETAEVADGVKVPACATIDAYAKVEKGVTLEAGAQVGTWAHVGENTRLQAYSRVEPDAVVGAGCDIGRGSVVDQGTRLARGTIVGDREHSRPDRMPNRTPARPAETGPATERGGRGQQQAKGSAEQPGR